MNPAFTSQFGRPHADGDRSFAFRNAYPKTIVAVTKLPALKMIGITVADLCHKYILYLYICISPAVAFRALAQSLDLLGVLRTN